MSWLWRCIVGGIGYRAV